MNIKILYEKTPNGNYYGVAVDDESHIKAQHTSSSIEFLRDDLMRNLTKQYNEIYISNIESMEDFFNKPSLRVGGE